MSQIIDRVCAESAVEYLLEYIGVDRTKSGIIETPRRVVDALLEMTAGYKEDPELILSKTFEDDCDEIIILRNIPFNSLCEHHLLPFSGSVDVGYLPGKVVGLSKLARLVDCFARRLQMQERMTRQIADSIMQYLSAQGAAVVVRASHACMACRGVKKSGAEMVTSRMIGVFRDKPEARAEFLALCDG
jgi:GTP cyclohydrolase IA